MSERYSYKIENHNLIFHNEIKKAEDMKDKL